MNLKRWDPLQQLASLRENLRHNMNRILEEGLASVGGANIALDMYETEHAVVIETSPLLGITGEDIEVSITGDVLTIQGETKKPEGEKKANYLRKERRFGHFSRSITIPSPIVAEETTATFKDGILTITIPKSAATRPQVIDVRSADS